MTDLKQRLRLRPINDCLYIRKLKSMSGQHRDMVKMKTYFGYGR